MNIRNIRRKIACAVALVLVACVALALPRIRLVADGVQAYLYGYSLVTMDLSRQVMTAPGPWLAPGAPHRAGAGPVNQFSHMVRFPDDTFHDVVAPNVDTLYSTAWLDLSSEPMVLTMPEMQGRWVLVEVLDAWTNAFASLGTRVFGEHAHQYFITGPAWKGAIPAGMTHVASPTNLAWIIGRTYTRDATDIPAVQALQSQYHLQPLSKFHASIQGGGVPNLVADPTIDNLTPTVTQMARLDAAAFFTRLAKLLLENPPPAADGPMMARLERLGILSGKPFSWNTLDPTTRQALSQAVWLVHGFFEARAPGTQGDFQASSLQRKLFLWANAIVDRTLLNRHNGWVVPLNLGIYGTHYPLRALVSLIGLGANPAEDAVYSMSTVDDKGDALDGQRHYVIHFDKDKLPPAKAFWSLTLYNLRGFLVDNSIHRYAIGDRNALRFNSDGSLDLLIQNQAPDAADANNWLPVPNGPFKLALRLYEPTHAVLTGQWVPPPVRRVK